MQKCCVITGSQIYTKFDENKSYVLGNEHWSNERQGAWRGQGRIRGGFEAIFFCFCVSVFISGRFLAIFEVLVLKVESQYVYQCL